MHVAGEPVVSTAPPLREILLADGLGVLGETGGERCGIALHGSAPELARCFGECGAPGGALAAGSRARAWALQARSDN